jgi:DNA-directed RNA polymerase specialized sigma24 family protein
VAFSLVPAATAFGRKYQLDPDTVHELMMDAAKHVVESKVLKGDRAGVGSIKNLPAYLFAVARNLMVAELRRRKEGISIDDPQIAPAVREAAPSDARKFIETGILLSEIVKRMNPKARMIYTYRTHGYDYKEIAGKFADMGYPATAASLRSELSKAIARVSRELEEAGYY